MTQAWLQHCTLKVHGSLERWAGIRKHWHYRLKNELNSSTCIPSLSGTSILQVRSSRNLDLIHSSLALLYAKKLCTVRVLMVLHWQRGSAFNTAHSCTWRRPSQCQYQSALWSWKASRLKTFIKFVVCVEHKARVNWRVGAVQVVKSCCTPYKAMWRWRLSERWWPGDSNSGTPMWQARVAHLHQSEGIRSSRNRLHNQFGLKEIR